jgi:hypothetical protein
MGKTEGRRPLGKPRRLWVANTSIEMDLGEIGRGNTDWIDVIHDKDQWKALVNTVMKLPMKQSARKLLSSCTIGGFSAWN